LTTILYLLKIDVTNLQGELYMILKTLVVGPIIENTYIIGSKQTLEAVIIDPGGEPARVISEIENLHLNVKYILNTHGHGDHIGAVASLKQSTGAEYGIHQADADMLKRDNSWIKQVMPDFEHPPEPDFYVKHDDIIVLGDINVRVIETPGHTQGGVCYYIGESVFTGDTLFQGSIGRFDMPGGDGNQLIKNIITRLMTLPTDTKVYPGHGSESTIAREKLTNPFLTSGIG